MTSDPTAVDDVRKWLEQGGYILEMAVARKLRGFDPFWIEQGYRYTDVSTGKEREGDISVGWLLHEDEATAVLHGLRLFIECKNTTAPWIFFLGGGGGNGPWSARAHLDDDCETCEAMDYAISQVVEDAPRAYALTEKRNRNATDHAFEAVQQVTSALLAEFAEAQEGHGERTVSIMGEPIVVTRSPLFTCELDNDGEVTLKSVGRVGVLVPRTDLPDKAADGVVVTVVHMDELDDLTAAMLTSHSPGGAAPREPS